MIDDMGTKAVCQFVLNEIKCNRHFVCVWTGRPGTGKSWSALRLGQILSEAQGNYFGPENVVFTPGDYIKKIKNPNNKRGEVVIFDEAGTGFGHLDYMSKVNRALQLVMQTMRYRNLINMMTVPNFKHVDKSARVHTDCRFQTKFINTNQNYTVVKPLMLLTDWSGRNESWEKFLRINDGSSGGKVVKEIRLKKPAKDVIKWYQERKEAFTAELWADLEDEVRGDDGSPKEKEPLTDIEQLIWDGFETGKFGSVGELAKAMGVKSSMLSGSIVNMRNKGYDFPPPSLLKRYRENAGLANL